MKFAGYGVLLVAWIATPFLIERHAVDLLVFCGLYAIAGAGVGFLLGQGGIVNLGQAAFYGLAAYSSAFCSTRLGLPAPRSRSYQAMARRRRRRPRPTYSGLRIGWA
ncbi:hypothetical protein IVB05_26890 [Bradyrhizobium sp. 170]|nr:hypothetical protein IVB05_26890 [Bradyrhizobium sp. 170]